MKNQDLKPAITAEEVYQVLRNGDWNEIIVARGQKLLEPSFNPRMFRSAYEKHAKAAQAASADDNDARISRLNDFFLEPIQSSHGPTVEAIIRKRIMSHRGLYLDDKTIAENIPEYAAASARLFAEFGQMCCLGMDYHDTTMSWNDPRSNNNPQLQIVSSTKPLEPELRARIREFKHEIVAGLEKMILTTETYEQLCCAEYDTRIYRYKMISAVEEIAYDLNLKDDHDIMRALWHAVKQNPMGIVDPHAYAPIVQHVMKEKTVVNQMQIAASEYPELNEIFTLQPRTNRSRRYHSDAPSIFTNDDKKRLDKMHYPEYTCSMIARSERLIPIIDDAFRN